MAAAAPARFKGPLRGAESSHHFPSQNRALGCCIRGMGPDFPRLSGGTQEHSLEVRECLIVRQRGVSSRGGRLTRESQKVEKR